MATQPRSSARHRPAHSQRPTAVAVRREHLQGRRRPDARGRQVRAAARLLLGHRALDVVAPDPIETGARMPSPPVQGTITVTNRLRQPGDERLLTAKLTRGANCSREGPTHSVGSQQGVQRVSTRRALRTAAARDADDRRHARGLLLGGPDPRARRARLTSTPSHGGRGEDLGWRRSAERQVVTTLGGDAGRVCSTCCPRVRSWLAREGARGNPRLCHTPWLWSTAWADRRRTRKPGSLPRSAFRSQCIDAFRRQRRIATSRRTSWLRGRCATTSTDCPRSQRRSAIATRQLHGGLDERHPDPGRP